MRDEGMPNLHIVNIINIIIADDDLVAQGTALFSPTIPTTAHPEYSD